MKLTFTGILLLWLMSCEDDHFRVAKVLDDPQIITVNGTWKVLSYEDYAAEEIILPDSSNSWGYDIIVTFSDTQNPPSLTGRNTTNSIFGTFSYKGHRSIEFGKVAGTYVGQPVWADEFSEVFQGEEALFFAINSSFLRVFYRGGQNSVTLEKQ